MTIPITSRVSVAKGPEGMTTKPAKLFISHTHSDGELAHAIRDLMRTVFGDKVDVVYSTSKELGGGPAPGHDWFQWITTQVQESRSALVLLTPSAIQKPWILWEAGAVFGAALGRADEGGNVLPVTYGLKTSEIPSPIEKQRIQAIDGDSPNEMRRLMNQFVSRDFGDVLTRADVVNAISRLDDALKEYDGKVRTALLKMPVTLTEASVQEWLARINELEDDNRLSEVKQCHQWLDIAFGRDPHDASPRPLDIRIHRKLGQLYLGGKEYKRAIEQFDLARQLAPRDVYVLRMLGQALLDEKDYERAREIIEAVETLDEKAFERNAECAALKGRWCTERSDAAQAREIYRQALHHNPESHYLADLLGQTQLSLGEREDAKRTYERVQKILAETGKKRNVWTLATSATANLVQGKEDEAMDDLRAIRHGKHTEANLNSIERGLRKLRESLGADAARFEEWRRVLRG